MIDVVIYLAAIIVLLLTYAIRCAREHYGKIDNLGFPVVKPSLFRGSVLDIHKKVAHYEDIKRYEKYGPIWGLYQGKTPVVFVADPELIKLIYVRDTDYFFDREPFEFGNPILNEILDFLPGEKWKAMRVSQTKLFSSGKIKQYSNEIFKKSMEDFNSMLEQDVRNSPRKKLKINTRDRFTLYTIDAISRSMLSMKTDPNDKEFHQACHRLIGQDQTISSFYLWTLIFPSLAKFEPTLVMDPAMPKRFVDLMTLRKKSGQRCGDYGDIMIELMSKLNTPEFKRLGISETTVLGQAVNLFLAGFDRISTIMTFLMYHLAKSPMTQRKLHEEIVTVLERHDNDINYQSLSEMPYLNACISEASRMYPTFIRPERVCNKDWECAERGIRIPKGVVVQIASWAVNRNPKIYDNPHEFIPERFLGENKQSLNPYAFSTFGFGHRNCIGMRFAYEAMRVGVAHMIQRFKFEVRDDTLIKFKPGVIMILQFDPVYLDVSLRES